MALGLYFANPYLEKRHVNGQYGEHSRGWGICGLVKNWVGFREEKTWRIRHSLLKHQGRERAHSVVPEAGHSEGELQGGLISFMTRQTP